MPSRPVQAQSCVRSFVSPRLCFSELASRLAAADRFANPAAKPGVLECYWLGKWNPMGRRTLVRDNRTTACDERAVCRLTLFKTVGRSCCSSDHTENTEVA